MSIPISRIALSIYLTGERETRENPYYCMAHEVLRVPVIRTRSSASRRYLFFEHPPALWIADEKDEGHERILRASGRKKPAAAGWILAFSDELQVDATGSIDLNMPTKHPKSVCVYIASLPGKSKQQITEHGI